MSEKILKFDNIGVNKKKFHKSKQTIDLDLLKEKGIKRWFSTKKKR